jgi:hypothetical protein
VKHDRVGVRRHVWADDAHALMPGEGLGDRYDFLEPGFVAADRVGKRMLADHSRHRRVRLHPRLVSVLCHGCSSGSCARASKCWLVRQPGRRS